MIKFNTLREVVQFRIIESEDNYWVEDYWKAAIEMYVKDISATIMFFQNDCDNEELYFLSEIFEEIFEQTQSRDLFSAVFSLHRVLGVPRRVVFGSVTIQIHCTPRVNISSKIEKQKTQSADYCPSVVPFHDLKTRFKNCSKR